MSVRASLAYLVTRGASGALAMMTTAVFARLLGPQGYEPLTLAVTLAAFAGSIAIQPVHSCLGRFLPGRNDPLLTASLGRLLCAGAGLVVIVALALEAIAPAWLPRGVLLGAAVLCVGQGLFDFSAQWASAKLMARRYGGLYLCKSVIVLALGLILLNAGVGYWGALLAMSVAYVVASSVCMREPWRDVWQGHWDGQAMAGVGRYARGISLSMILGVTLFWSDRLLFRALDVPGLGAYGAASDLAAQGFGLIFSALFLAWYPRLVAAWERSPAEFPAQMRRYLQLSVTVLLPLAAGFALVSQDISHLMLGRSFAQDAPRLLPWLAGAALMNGLRTYVTDIALQLRQKMGLQCLVTALCGACSIALNLYLLPRYGVIGAAWSACGANALGLLLGLALAQRLGGMPWPWSDIGLAVLGVAMMRLALLYIPEGTPGLFAARVSVGALVYIALALATDLAGGRTWLLARWAQRSGSHD